MFLPAGFIRLVVLVYQHWYNFRLSIWPLQGTTNTMLGCPLPVNQWRVLWESLACDIWYIYIWFFLNFCPTISNSDLVYVIYYTIVMLSLTDGYRLFCTKCHEYNYHYHSYYTLWGLIQLNQQQIHTIQKTQIIQEGNIHEIIYISYTNHKPRLN